MESGRYPGTNGDIVLYRQPSSILALEDGSVWIAAYGSNELVRIDVNGIIRQSVQATGMRPLAALEQLGFLSPRVTAAHMTHLTDEEIALTAQRGISVAHNPRSNMKLGSGIAPIAKLLQAGANVGLGTDGAASNNSLDILADARLAALLAKVNGSPTAVSAAEALRMATINGAKALGIADQVGSIETGKQADIIAVDLGTIEAAPVFDPVSQIVYATNREQITHVWIAGEHLLKERRFARLNESELVGMAEQWRAEIRDSGRNV